MKRYFLIVASLIACVFAFAEETIHSRGPHNEVRQHTRTVVENGKTITVTNSYTVLRSGLNYFSPSDNTWKPTSERIEITPAGASYKEGPFRVDFTANYRNADGAVKIVLPDGQRVRIQTTGLSLTDIATGQSFWLGEIRDSHGALDGNKIIYADAFHGIKADIVVKISIGQFESDVILREQVTAPQALGLDPATCRLEIWHKILEMPESQARVHSIRRADGVSDPDETLDFGSMLMAEGAAFLVGTNRLPVSTQHGPIAVAKERFRDEGAQTTYLIESVPYTEAVAHLNALPKGEHAIYNPDKLREKLETARSVARKSKRTVPVSLADAVRSPKTDSAVRQVAGIIPVHQEEQLGFVFDYTLVSSISNYRFRGDETYYVTGQAHLTGATVIEGGTVVKFPPYNASAPARVVIYGAVSCLTGPYSPAIFTADADSSVGQPISSSPLAGYYGWFNLYFPSSNPNVINLHDIFTRYAHFGISVGIPGTHTLANIHAVNCYYGLQSLGNIVNVQNALAYNCVAIFIGGNNSIFNAEHVTAHASQRLITYSGTGVLNLKNSLVIGMTYASAGVVNDHVTTLFSDAGIFQKVGSGEHYLAASSPYRNIGTDQISDSLKKAFLEKTTHPPVLISHDITKDWSLSPVVSRDDRFYDLGYHYDAIDYAVGERAIQDATVTLKGGVAVAVYKDYGFGLQANSRLISEGHSTKPNRIFRYLNVQEAPVRWDDPGTIPFNQSLAKVFGNSEIQIHDTELLFVADIPSRRMIVDNVTGQLSELSLTHSKIANGYLWLSPAISRTLNFEVFNCLWLNPYILLYEWNDGSTGHMNTSFRNNTFLGGYFSLDTDDGDGGALNWAIFDNVFWLTPTFYGGTSFSSGFNAFTNSFRFPGDSDSVQISNYPYTIKDDRYYLPAGSALRDAGSQGDAALVGMYHFTTSENQTKESTTRLDMGVHYPSLGSDGKLLDSDSDGLADMVEDANQDGLLQSAETAIDNADSDDDGVTDSAEVKNGTNPREAGKTGERRLAYWSFDNNSFGADTGQQLIEVSSAERPSGIPSFRGASAYLDDSADRLVFNEIEKDGNPNLSRAKGSIRFWFRTDWAYVTVNGSGIPQAPNYGRLVSIGMPTTGSDRDWWNLQFRTTTPDAMPTIQFQTEAGAATREHFNVSLPDNWKNRNRWHQIVVTFDSAGVKLYLDGVLLGSHNLPCLVPGFTKRLNDRLTFGNTQAGGAHADGYFDDIETFNYVLPEDQVKAEHSFALDADFDYDNLGDVEEVNEALTNPRLADTDGDGLPDGWEYIWNYWRGQRPGFNPAASGEQSLNYDSDSWSNLQEYRMGLNPYSIDNQPTPLPSHTRLPSQLINLDFGTGAAHSGLAAVGANSGDVWNKVGPRAQSMALSRADGTGSGATVSLVMDLGHVTKFSVNCVTVNDPPPQPKYYCDWLTGTNIWQNVFCCTNLNNASPEMPAGFFCMHSQTGKAMYLHDQWSGPEWEVIQLPGQRMFRSLTPSWPWQARYHSWAGPQVFGWNLQPQGSYFWGSYGVNGWNDPGNTPTTTAQSFLTPASLYVDLAPTPDPVSLPVTSSRKWISATPSMQWATVEGFDQAGNFPSGNGVAAIGVLNDYLWNSMDGQVVSQPQSAECDSYWFIGDGHAAINIESLPFARYTVLLYGAKPNFSGDTKVTVNGMKTTIPSGGAQLTKWVHGANFQRVSVGYVTSIKIEFEELRSLISGIQIIQEAESASIGEVNAEYSDGNGVKIDWTVDSGADYGFDYLVYRCLLEDNEFNRPAAPEKLIAARATSFSAWDAKVPFGFKVRYRVVAVDDAGIDRGYRYSNILPAVQRDLSGNKRFAPTVTHIRTLQHTYVDTPYTLTAGKLQFASDVMDEEGDQIFFEVVKLLQGSLIVKVGTGNEVTYTPTSNLPDSPILIGPGTLVKWLPPAGKIGRDVLALTVRATDGALKSPQEPAEVRIDVLDTSALMWWGASIWGMHGTGQTTHWRSYQYEQWWHTTPRDEHFTIDPSPVLAAADQVTPAGADRRITNVVQVAAGNLYWPVTRAAVCADGSLWVWGRGNAGTLGDGQYHTPAGGEGTSLPKYMTIEATQPIRVPSLNDVQSVAAGYDHMLALRSDGTVWGWGNGQQGQLGVPETLLPEYSWHKYKASEGFDSAIRATATPFQVPNLKGIAAIAADGSASLAITTSGELYWWGFWEVWDKNTYLDLFHARSITPQRVDIPGKVVQVVPANGNSFLALNDDGEVYGWGENSGLFAQDLPGGEIYTPTPVRIPIANVASIAARSSHAVAVMRDGTVQQWGLMWPPLDQNKPTPVHGLRNIVKVSTSGEATLALDKDGRVYGWGYSSQGTLQHRISDPDWKWLAASGLHEPARAAEWRAVVMTPRFGYFKNPIQLDSFEWAENIAAVSDGGYAVASLKMASPRGLTAESHDGYVDLSWKRLPNASQYEIQRQVSNGMWVSVAGVGDELMPRVNWRDSAVKNGEFYRYKVRAIVAGASTEFSHAVEAWPSTVPSAVEGFTGQAQSRQAHLSWIPTPRALKYDVWRKVGSDNFVFLKTVQQTDPVASPGCGVQDYSNGALIHVYDPHLDPNKTYTYKIRAVNAIGVGLESAEVSITPTSENTNLPGFQVAPDPYTFANVSWTSRVGLGAGAEFYVRVAELVKTTPTGDFQEGRTIIDQRIVGKPAEQQNSLALGPLTQGRKYRIKMSEFSSCGGEGPTQAVDIDTGRINALAPLTLEFKKDGGNYIYARWRGSAASYLIELKNTTPNPDTFHMKCAPLFDIVEPDDNGVAEYYRAGLPDGSYQLRIQQCSLDYAPPSGVDDVVQTFTVGDLPNEVRPDEADLPPVNVTVADNRLMITWWGEDEYAWQTVDQYRGWRFILFRSGPQEVGLCDPWVQIFDGTELGVQDAEVKNGSSYKYRLYAIGPNLEVRVRDSADNQQPAPSFNSGITLSGAPRNQAVELSWTEIPNLGSGGVYELEGSAARGGPHPTLTIVQAGGVRKFTDFNVRNGIEYSYRVIARKKNGDAIASTEITVKPSEASDLTKPTGVVADVADSCVTLQWLESPGADRYFVNSSQTPGPFFTAGINTPVTPKTFNQNDFTITAQRRTETATTAFTVLAWAPPLEQTVSEYWVYHNGTAVENVIAKLPPSSRFFAEDTRRDANGQLQAGLYHVKAIVNSIPISVAPWTGDHIAELPPELVSISLNDLPNSITSPTNFTVSVTVENFATLPVRDVQFFVDGVLIATDRTIPFDFTWVNPPGKPNGWTHTLKARLIDQDGYIAETPEKQITVYVIPEIRKFTTAATDLQIAAPGIPLGLTRLYDSEDPAQGLLGKGWRFDWEAAKMIVPDLSFGYITPPAPARRDYVTLEEKYVHRIEVHLRSKDVHVFHPVAERDPFYGRVFDVEEGSGEWVHPVQLNFFPLAGSFGELREPGMDTFVGVPVEAQADQFYLLRGEGKFRPMAFEYSDAGGATLTFAADPADESQTREMRLSSMKDAFDNSLTWTPAATGPNFEVKHSNGRALYFRQSAGVAPYDGTWWDVIDPIGYNGQETPAAGAIPAVRFFVKNVPNSSVKLLSEVHKLTSRTPTPVFEITRYQYDASHRLIRVANHDGVILLENEYDAGGLLSRQIGPMGLKQTITPAPPSEENGKLEFKVNDNIGDGAAIPSVIYSAGGAVVGSKRSEAAGAPEAKVGYDRDGRPAYQVDENGAYTSYSYDAAGRVTSVTDALENQTFISYTSSGDPLVEQDAKGFSTRYDYYEETESSLTGPNDVANPKGTLRAVTDALGTRTEYTYNSKGQVLSEKKTSPYGGPTPTTLYRYHASGSGDLVELREPLYDATKPDFYVTTYEYDANGNRKAEIKKRRVIARDQGGIVQTSGGATVMDTQEIRTEFVYDGQNRLIGTAAPLSQKSGSLYDINGRVVKSTNVLGQITSYTYDPRGNLIQTLLPNGAVTRSVYDGRGRVIWTQDPCTPSGTDTTGPATETVYDAVGQVRLVRRYENTTLRLVALQTVNETPDCPVDQTYFRVLSGTAPVASRMTCVSPGVLISFRRSDFNSFGQLKYSVDEAGGVTEFVYDELGRRSSVKRYETYTVTSETSPISPPAGTAMSKTEFGYDSNGNQSWVKDGNERQTDFEFDRLNRQVAVVHPAVGNEPRRRTTTEFNGLGFKVADTDEQGIATAYAYDLVGRLTTVTNDIRPIYTLGQEPVVTEYGYDEVGNQIFERRVTHDLNTSGYLVNVPSPTLIRNDLRTTRYEYDALGRRTLRFLPGASLNDVNSNRSREKTEYLLLGPASGPWTARHKVTDFRGFIITSDFDIMGRLATNALPQANYNIEVARTIEYKYSGDLLNEVSESGTGLSRRTYYAYDNLRRLRKKDTPEGVLTYAYNVRNQVATMKAFRRSSVAVNAEVGSAVPDAHVEYGYDPLARLMTVKNWKLSGANVSTNFYDPAGALIETSAPNQSRHRFIRNERNHIKNVLIEKVDTAGVLTLQRDFEYTLNPAGMRKQVIEKLAGGTERRRVNYHYDFADPLPVVGRSGTAENPTDHTAELPRLNRLTRETFGSSDSPRVDYTYDLVGNRLSRKKTGTVANTTDQTFAYNIKDQVAGTSSPLTFDDNGNTIGVASGPLTSYYYDAQNRLIQASGDQTTVTCSYDHAGNRVRKSVQSPYQSGYYLLTTYYLIDELNPTGDPQVVVETFTTSSTPSPGIAAFHKAYEYGANLISIRTPSTTYWVGADGHGSVRMALSSTGNIVAGSEFDYDAYGKFLNTPSLSSEIHYRYTGEQWDQDLGMYYLRARYYNPEYGRFWSMDAYEGWSNAPDSLHKYLYCSANPINNIDPSGNMTIPEIGGVFTKIGALGARSVMAVSNARWAAYARLMPVMDKTWRAVFWADFITTAIGAAALVGPEALNLAADLGARVNRAYTMNSTPIPPGWGAPNGYGSVIENIGGQELESMGGRYIGGNVKGIDGTLGVGQGNVLVSFKAHDVSEDTLLQTIRRDMKNLQALDPADIRGTDVNGDSYRLPNRPVGGRVTVIAVPAARAQYIISPQFIEGLRKLAEETKTVPVVRAVRNWSGRR